jgi:hypothetical protein
MEIAAQFGDGTMRKLLATTVLAIIGGIALSVPASATDLTFTVQGTVTSFIDVDNVYGFGAGANLAGDAVTDVYTIDTSTTTLSRYRSLWRRKQLSGV